MPETLPLELYREAIGTYLKFEVLAEAVDVGIAAIDTHAGCNAEC